MNRDNKYEPKMPEYLKANLGLDDNNRRKRPSNPSGDMNSRPRENQSRNRNNQSKPRDNSKTRQSGNQAKDRRPSQSKSRPVGPRLKERNNVASRDPRVSNSNVRDNRNSRPNTKSNAGKPGLRDPRSASKDVKAKQQRANNASRKMSAGNRPQKSTNTKRIKPRKKRTFNRFLQSLMYLSGVFFGFLTRGGNKDKYISPEEKKYLNIRFSRTISIMLFLFLVIVLVLNVITPVSKISVAENRELQQKPELSISRLLNGEYASDYSKYMSDQFVKRDTLIGIKARFDLLLGKKQINGVYIADNGYLMEGFKMSDKATTDSKIEALNKFASDNSKLKTTLMLVPNKVEIYKNLLPKNRPDDSQVDYVKNVQKSLSSSVKLVELFDSFEKQKNNEQLYFKTDHHWTVDGAYIAYEEYCKSLNLEPVGLNSLEKNLASNTFKGSLYYKNGARIGGNDSLYLYLDQNNDKPVIVKYYDEMKKVPSLYNAEKLQGRDPYEVFTGGNHTQIKIRTAVKTERKLLVIKDSYANAMLPYLVNNFAEINVVDLRYFAGSVKDIIQSNDITDVLVLYNINTFNTDSSILNINE